MLNQNYWLVNDFASLNTVADDIASAICGTGLSAVEGKLGYLEIIFHFQKLLVINSRNIACSGINIKMFHS